MPASVGHWVSTRQSGSPKQGCVLVETNAQNTKDVPACNNKVGGVTHTAAAFENKKKVKFIEDFVKVLVNVYPQ